MNNIDTNTNKLSVAKILTLVLLGLVFCVCAFFAASNLIKYVSTDTSKHAFPANQTWQMPQKTTQPVKETAYEGSTDILKIDNIKIVSYSNKWKGEKLREIYDELMKNTIGDEIQYLQAIFVHPDEPASTDEYSRLGEMTTGNKVYKFFVDFKALFPIYENYTVDVETGLISLYEMDKYDHASQAARTISHEYGHHYTIRHFFSDEDKQKEYFKARNLKNYPKAKLDMDVDTYYKNHDWSIYEIAAEDYVQLMGSPNTKKIGEFKDIVGVMQYEFGSDKKYKLDITFNETNVFQQENIYMPIATQVDGLGELFYGAIGKKYTPQKSYDALTLNYKRFSSGSKVRYEFTWNDAAPGATYTLICFDSHGQVLKPIKTVKNSELKATIGKVSKETRQYIYTWYDTFLKDTKYFRLYAHLQNGDVIASKNIKITF